MAEKAWFVVTARPMRAAGSFPSIAVGPVTSPSSRDMPRSGADLEFSGHGQQGRRGQTKGLQTKIAPFQI
ncbi:MAG: hypothetical protein A2Z37_04960 [Chloroflexi bacterium RBG_19FT_COMBO_62_14]|nr:MAG: hypothetical protein A2Z37_04960 [Chloroflexi bacterium RBG_19FT_COMBO_62_14]